MWNEYCDWYLELYQADTGRRRCKQRNTGSHTTDLDWGPETILRLAHPLIPYITEELWQQVAPLIGRGGDTVSKAPYPISDASKVDTLAEADVEWMKSVIVAVRTIRGELNLSPGKEIPMILAGGTSGDRDRPHGWNL